MLPLPLSMKDLLNRKTANFSLAFPRLVEWRETDASVKPNTDTVKSLLEIANNCLDSSEDLLKAIHNRQESIINDMVRGTSLEPVAIYAKLSSPFISGLGSGHPNETGMILDRNTGCPFLPASSIKGVLRIAHALNLAEKDPSLVNNGEIDDKMLKKYFGTQETRGQLVILDAYPLKPPVLKIDIMNPHYSGYYMNQNAKGPVETEFPIPIKFLTVGEGCDFVFRAFFLPLASGDSDAVFTEDDTSAVHAMFATAFSLLGFGGKTSIGYGRFIKTETPQKAKPKAEKGGLVIGNTYEAKLDMLKKNWRINLLEFPKIFASARGVPLGKAPKTMVKVTYIRDGNPKEFEYIEDSKS
ncbi:type III-B CRISPR module RAMP protein Cmr6 [Leadbettera azotonutricia]|uniref:Crispr-associated ramp protein, Cmr6 family n=1 Tax=Leadbettera azotonutricia (strain ATCC BAA-888 / DSM 13862 / ZAS-9) TaxID=545695 RepID=F5YCJ2_LEAAZ|nr:type III-B CRISPR module RAMP protein Cmr6 [Leadbettera azotonutricia]AEF81009.1 crispr-associated ramp protein, Cmr6 family [Leadbettera azotonutricia ZAS-9]